ncbi:MAG: hypothetical protein JNK04_04000, partial [Myxococcales bacterium]|nr:hypothetical protein [Myxococcales bacterium]
GGDCQTEFQACNADGTSGSCTTCIERFGGESGAFCAGSQALYDNYFNCICSSGVCLD